MKLLFLKLQLALHLGVFLLKLLANVSNKVKPAIITVFILSLFIIATTIITNTKPVQETHIVWATPPVNTQLYIENKVTKEEIQSQIAFWEQVLKMQPNSRDVLLNLANLYAANTQLEIAADYKESAVSLDPNNPLFE